MHDIMNRHTPKSSSWSSIGYFVLADCDRPCPPGGQLAADCSVCECANAVLTGQVLNQADSIPLVDVSVYVMGRQWHPSATTDRLGQFELKDLCISGLKLTFKKNGFMSELDVYNAENSNPIVIKMKKLGKLPILCFLLVSAFVVS